MATFRKIDDSAIAADRPLSTATLNDIAESNDAARQERVRCGTLSLDARDPWQISALYPMAIPLMWRVTPGVDTLHVHLRYNTTTTLDPVMHVSVAVVKAENILSGLYEPATRTSFPSSASTTNKTIVVELHHLQGAIDWVCVFVIFQSAQGTIADLTKAGKTPYEINQGGAGNLVSCEDNDTHNYAGAPYIPAMGLQKWFLNDEDSTQYPYTMRQQICLITGTQTWASPANRLLYWLYPPTVEYDISSIVNTGATGHVNLINESTADNNMYARIFELGVLKLNCITIEEQAAVARATRGNSLNASLMPRSRTTSALYSDGERVFAQQTRIHALGSVNDPTDIGLLSKPRYHVGNYVHDLNSAYRKFNDGEWQTIAQAPVGDGGQYVDTSGSTLTNTLIEASGLLLLAQFVDVRGRFGWSDTGGADGVGTSNIRTLTYDGVSVRARLRVVDFDGTSNAVNSDDGDGEAFELLNYAAVNIRQTRNDQNATHPHGYLSSWFIDGFEQSTGGVSGTNRYRHKVTNHALRDLWDIRYWGDTPFIPFRLAVKDTQTGARRLCLLQINIPAPPDTQSTTFAKYCHLVTWSVIQSPVLRPDETTMGA